MENTQLFAGIVCIQVQKDAFTIEQHNERWVCYARNQEEAIGFSIRETMAKFPTGKVVYQAMDQISDLARKWVAANPLAAEASDNEENGDG